MRPGVWLLALGVLLGAPAAAAAPDGVARARALALGGDRAQALALLEAHLRDEPDDGDALVLMGTVLSWQGRYDEARRCLERVLDRSPGHFDALRAAINVELWSDHPARAEALARAGLEHEPRDRALLLARARALRDVGRTDEAERTVGDLLSVAPEDAEGLALRGSLAESARVWEVAFRYTYDRFDDGRDDWSEGVVALSRRFGFGRVAFRYYHARHFGADGDQLELEAFPSLRPGTSLDVAVATSPQSVNYPGYRLQLDVWQSLGAGFEASVGYRHLAFDSGVEVFVVTLNKYLGSWMLIGKSFITPSSSGTSVSVHAAVRRYFGARASYVGLRYGHGVSREEIASASDVTTLTSDTVAGELELDLGRLRLNLNASYGRGDRFGRTDLGDWSFGAGSGFRF